MTSGPQRERKDARVLAISNFLAADSRNTIPTAIILAFTKGGATFKPVVGPRESAGAGHLAIKESSGFVAEIVDGQHRLYGMNAFNPNTEAAVVSLLDADPVEKAFQFLVINNKSSRVPATHTKALLARMKSTALVDRLKGARLAFDAEGIKDVDLINNDRESPFYHTIDWATTPGTKRMVQATAIELSLDYIEGLGVPEFQDRDIRRSVFLSIWRVIRDNWSALWKPQSRLVSKVAVICLTRFICDRITNWADSDDLDIEITNLEQIEQLTKKLISKMDARFWTTPWAEKAQGGFDTNQGRDRVLTAITQLYRNGRRDIEWYTDIDIIERSAASSGS
jgi:DGQHR domain-containing protein